MFVRTTSTVNGRLLVMNEKYNIDDALVCNTTSTVSSASITCNISGLGGIFVATGYNNRGAETLEVQERFDIPDGIDDLGLFGFIGGIFIIITAGLVFMANEIAGVVAVNIAVIFTRLTGMIHFSITTIISIMFISIIIIGVLQKNAR